MQSPEFLVAIALGAGVICQLLAYHMRVPSIVLLLTAGVLLGPEGAGVIVPERLGDGLFGVVALGVAVILFEGGLAMDLRRLRRESVAIPRLITIGVFVTGLGAALTARYVMQWEWGASAVFGSLVVVTGPTVIRPLLGIVRARPNVSTILEAEGVFADPIGALLAAITLQVVLGDTVGAGALDFAMRLGFGVAVGAALAALIAWLIKKPGAMPRDLEHVFVLGVVLAAFELSESVYHESGLVAVTLAGALVIQWAPRAGVVLREFKEQLTNAFIGLLFVLLAADIALDDVLALGWRGVATVAIVAFVVRPLTILSSVPASQATLRERAFLSWMAPRGIVAAAVASLTALAMERQGMEGGPAMRALVFLTIAVTVVVQGGLAPIVAGLLGVREMGRSTVVILGAGELALILGERLICPTRKVTFIDVDPERIARIENKGGFGAIWGNGLEATTRARAQLRYATTVIALTANEEVNLLFAREAKEHDAVPEAMVRVGVGARGLPAKLLENDDAHMLFGEPVDLHMWNRRVRQDEVALFELTYDADSIVAEPDDDSEPETKVPTKPTSQSLLLAWTRTGKSWEPVTDRWKPKTGDRALAIVWTKKRQDAVTALTAAGWSERRDAQLWRASRRRAGP